MCTLTFTRVCESLALDFIRSIPGRSAVYYGLINQNSRLPLSHYNFATIDLYIGGIFTDKVLLCLNI